MDEERFEPRLGRQRAPASPRGRRYLSAILASATRAGWSSRSGSSSFNGSRIARGSAIGRLLRSRDRHAGLRARRGIVKVRLVRLAGKGLGAARAHLRYIERDAASGPDKLLYSADRDQADGSAFIERCTGDRHQFRLIVSAEDGAEYDDLRPLVRRFMRQMEEDLETRLDWVAADHADTLHPHSHVIVRGKDEAGANLVIAPDYIRRGMRERLAELVTLDLGPKSDLEIQRQLRRDVEAERVTATDRRLLREADGSRTVSVIGRDAHDQAIRAGRLKKLEALGLARSVGAARWQLAPDVEDQLRALGERGDIIRTMQRALTATGASRALAEQRIFDPAGQQSITGRLLARGLSDEQTGRHFVIIDGIDGRSYYADIGPGDRVEPMTAGSIVRLSARLLVERPADRTIAEVAAANDGIYSVERHLALHRRAGGDFADAHVRRLQAMRRQTGYPEREPDGSWHIASDHLARARAYEERLRRVAPVSVALLSPLPLERLARHDGLTWLDRELVEPTGMPRDQGFGQEVRSALAVRRAWLVEQGLATKREGPIAGGSGMLRLLERRGLAHAASGISARTGLEFRQPVPGGRLEGVVRERLNLASGRYAMIDDGRSFALVPWRPVLERALGRQVAGEWRRGGGISWSIERERGPEL